MKYRATWKAEIIQLPFLYLPGNQETHINKNVITPSNRKNRFDLILFRCAPDLQLGTVPIFFRPQRRYLYSGNFLSGELFVLLKRLTQLRARFTLGKFPLKMSFGFLDYFALAHGLIPSLEVDNKYLDNTNRRRSRSKLTLRQLQTPSVHRSDPETNPGTLE